MKKLKTIEHDYDAQPSFENFFDDSEVDTRFNNTDSSNTKHPKKLMQEYKLHVKNGGCDSCLYCHALKTYDK